VRAIPVAQRLVRKLAKLLKVAPDVAGFRTVEWQAGWRAMEKLASPLARLDLRDEEGYEPVYGISRFIPVIGDDVLPDHPLAALAKGAGKEVELLIGTNTEEMNLYFVPPKCAPRSPASSSNGWSVSRIRAPRPRSRPMGWAPRARSPALP
jgi:para-nitrobenzyl esterase